MTTPAEYSFEILIALACLTGILGTIYLFSALKALKQLRLMKVSTRLVGAVIFIPLGLIFIGILTGLQGYDTFTHEELAAHLAIRPLAPQQFEARIQLPDGKESIYILEGDEVQIDANILKWKPIANLLGLHTHYSLDRISGRYRNVEDAQRHPHSVFTMQEKQWLDLAQWRMQYETLSFLLDAEYGSASFVAADKPRNYLLKVSSSGLLIRPENGTNAKSL